MSQRKIRAASAVLGATLLVGGIASLAAAEGNGTNLGPKQRLHVDGHCLDPATFADLGMAEPPISDAWVNTPDSVADGQNSKALRVSIPGSTASCLYYVEAYTGKSTGLNVPVENLRNLSFEFQNTASFEGGSPGFYVQLSDGSSVRAAGIDCNKPGNVRPSWSRADFTGDTAAGCTLFYNNSVPYTSGGGNSAWENFAASPDGAGKTVTVVALVIDGQAVPGSTGGTYYLDRIAVPNGDGAPGGSGTGAKMFNSSNTKGVNCTTEASC